MKSLNLKLSKNKKKTDQKFVLELYVTNNSILDARAIFNCQSILDNQLKSKFTLNIIDIRKNPEKAIKEGIIATPLLIRKSPKPETRIVGDLSDMKAVINELFII